MNTRAKFALTGIAKAPMAEWNRTRKPLLWYSSFSNLPATGIGAAAVTRELFKRGIPTPGEYKAAHGQQYHDVSRSRGRWSSSTVLRILEDERYIGSYVIGAVRAVIEVGGTRSRRKDRDKWFIIPDHHPAIVDKELFEKVQAVQRRFSLPTKKTREYPLKGQGLLRLLRPCTLPHRSKETVLYVPPFYCRCEQPLPRCPCRCCRVWKKQSSSL